MKIDYDSVKTKLAEVTTGCYELFRGKVLSNKNLNIEVKELINRFNTFFNLASQYIELVINNALAI